MPEDQAPQLPTLPPPPAPGLDPWTASPPAKRRPTRLVAGAIVVVIAVIAGAVAFSMLGSKEPRANAQPLALAFNSGESETYTMHMTMDGRMSAGELLGGEQQVLMDVTQVVTWEVKAVDEDGVATINVTVDEMRGTVNGLPIPSEAATTPPIEIQVAPDGRIVSAGGLSFLGSGQTGGASFPGMDQMTPLLPDGAVAPGDTWAKEFSQDVPFGEGKIEFTATSTFERYEDVNGIDAAVVTTEYTVPLDFSIDFDELLAAMGGAEGVTDLSEFGGVSLAYGGEGSFEQTAWIDPGAEEMLKTSSSGSFDMTMRFEGLDLFDGQTIAFAGEFTQELSRT